MALSIELVDGASFAEQASRILEEAWDPPALHYSPEYLRWQFGFPVRTPLPAVAGFDGKEPVGFAGITARRLRHRSVQWDSGVVSFVAVRPQWRNRGIAAQLYRRLLGTIRELAGPIITFAAAGSAGERTLLRAYPEAGFQMHSLGSYPICACMMRGEAPASSWEAEISENAALLPEIVEACAVDDRLIWSDPSEAQIRHYLLDPRPRKVILLRHRDTGSRGAAWVVRSEFRSPRGVETVTTVESLFLSRKDAGALPPLLRCAATAWTGDAWQDVVISAPSLYGFDAGSLRKAGIRQTGALFHAHLCALEIPTVLKEGQGTNLEVV